MPVIDADWTGQLLSGNRYQVQGKLGEGGMAIVYLAQDHEQGGQVVVKAPKAEMLKQKDFAARFLREIRSLVQLEHPHIVKVLDVGEHEKVPFLVMQYLPGGSLRERQQRGADGRALPMAAPTLGGWLAEVAAALDYIHERNYLHRDVKPDNLLFDEQGKVYLGDFGVAKVINDQRPEAQRTVLTQTGSTLGTPQYMAPELILAKKFDQRVDQYALAVTVFEWLSGKYPFDGPNPTAIFMEQLQKSPPALHELVTGLPAGLSEVLTKALAKNAKNRFGSCAEFAAAVLGQVGSVLPPRRPRPTLTPPPRQAAVVPLVPAAAPTIRVQCPSCQRQAKLPAGWEPGQALRCPKCHKQFIPQFEDNLWPTVLEANRSTGKGKTSLSEKPDPGQIIFGGHPPGRRGIRTGTFVLLLGPLVLAAAVGLEALLDNRLPPWVVVLGAAGIGLLLAGLLCLLWPSAAAPLHQLAGRKTGGVLLAAAGLAAVLVILVIMIFLAIFLPDVPPKIPPVAPNIAVRSTAASVSLVAGQTQQIPLMVQTNGYEGEVSFAVEASPAEHGLTWTIADKTLQLSAVKTSYFGKGSLQVRPVVGQQPAGSALALDFVTAPPKIGIGSVGLLTLKAGETKSVEVPLERNGYEGPIMVEGGANPAEVQVQARVSGDRINVELESSKEAKGGKGQIWLQAKVAGQKLGAPVSFEYQLQPMMPPGKYLTNSIGMKLVLIPPGKFMMGSPSNEKDRSSDETEHEVEITRPFHVGVYEVTQEEYQQVMGSNPSSFKGGRNPVESVSHNEAVEFCRKLSDMPKEREAGRSYRLLTEAEWEYGCRAGTTTPFHYGNSLSSKQANFNGNYPYGGAAKGKYLARTTTVGFYQPNAFGLYDMHGNVWEWCADWYDKDYYKNSPRQDPENTKEASYRVVRGGSWRDDGWGGRSASRSGDGPGSRNRRLGFRVAAVQSR